MLQFGEGNLRFFEDFFSVFKIYIYIVLQICSHHKFMDPPKIAALVKKQELYSKLFPRKSWAPGPKSGANDGVVEVF
jgi:hypothetical protein